MTARAVMEASTYAAIARYIQATGDGTPRRIAEPQLVDAILKAWDKTFAAWPGATPAERRAVLHAARTDIGRQPARRKQASRA